MGQPEPLFDDEAKSWQLPLESMQNIAQEMARAFACDREAKITKVLVEMGWTPPADGIGKDDIVNRLRLWADADVDETARDGSLEPNDIRLWGAMMREAADEIIRLRVLFRVNMLRHAGETSHAEIDRVLFPTAKR